MTSSPPFSGDTSVVVNRDDNGELHAFVNRCAHRGSTLVREPCGQRRVHTCVYHHWCYNLQGQLFGVPFERGIDGKGGMPEAFDKSDHGLQMIRLDTYRGVIFGTMSEDVEPLETYLDEPMRRNLDRIFCRPIEVLGYMRQRMTSNWKLYWENVCDPYHAGLLHQFAATSGLFRPTQAGGTVLDRWGRHMINYSLYESDDETDAISQYDDVAEFDTSLRLKDQSIIEFRDETGERDAVNVMAIYPGLVAARIVNTLSTRQIRPKSADEFELHWNLLRLRRRRRGFARDAAQAGQHPGPGRAHRYGRCGIGRTGPTGGSACTGAMLDVADGWARPYRESRSSSDRDADPRSLAQLLQAHGHRDPGMTNDAQKLRITEFLYDYVQYLDDDRLEEWPDFFVTDCLYKIMPRENVERELPLPLWYCDNQHMLHDRVQALRTSQIYNLHYDRHILSNVRVHDEQDGFIRCTLTGCCSKPIWKALPNYSARVNTSMRSCSWTASRSSRKSSWWWILIRCPTYSPPRFDSFISLSP